MKINIGLLTRFPVYLVLTFFLSIQIFAIPITSPDSKSIHFDTKLTDQIAILSKLGIKPIVFNKNLCEFHDDDQLLEYLNSYIPIKNSEDIYEIFSNQITFQLGKDTVINELLLIYDIFFNGAWTPEDIKILVFSGGTGSNQLTGGLLDYTDKIDMLINAYDDLEGTSNGTIRREFDVLGPSDISKNLVALLDLSYIENTALKNLLKFRFSKTEDITNLRLDLEVIAKNETDIHDQVLLELFSTLTPKYRKLIAKTFAGFLQEVREWEIYHDGLFDLRDFAVRNIVYTGLLFSENYQHNKAIETFKLQFHVKPNIILNNEKGLWLVGLTSEGNLLNSEGDISQSCLGEEIEDVFVWKSLLSEKEQQGFYNYKTLGEKQMFLKSNSVPIIASNEAKESIGSAQMILFAPTTFYSNVIPTLKTCGIKELLHESNNIKIHIANLTLERGNKTLGQQLADLQYFLSYGNTAGSTIDYVITHLSDRHKYDSPYILIDRDLIRHLGLELIELSVADPKQVGLHRSDVISKVVMQLQALDVAGYEIREGRCRKKNSDRKFNTLANMTDVRQLQFKQSMKNRLDEYLKCTYHAVFVDVDGTITDDSKEIPDAILKKLCEYISSGILVGINTARTDKTLEKKLLLPFSEALKNKPELLKNVYVYSNNGAHGYTLDGTTLYEHKISVDQAELAVQYIRNELLEDSETCTITPYKITILPNETKNPLSLVNSMNELLSKNAFPLIARLGADPSFKPSVIITKHRVDKKLALFDFVQHSSIPIDAIIKIGDKAAPGGVDNDWLIGKGSFSVNEFDENGTHVPLQLLTEQKCLAGTLWILEKVTLEPKQTSYSHSFEE